MKLRIVQSQLRMQKFSEKTYGPDVYAIKGKTTRKKPRALANDYIEIPRALIKAHQGIVLVSDVMFIDEVPFLVTMSLNIWFITIRCITNREADTLLEAFDATFLKYNKAGFIIKMVCADREFEPL